MAGSKEQELAGVEAALVEQESNNPSVMQELATSGVQTQRLVVDNELLDQIAQTLKDQMSKFINQIKPLAKAKVKRALALVPISMIRAEDADASLEEAKRKRGRKPNTKLLGELSISFQLPKNCIPNNIDLEKYYYHNLSQQQCRSKPEVVQFVLTKTCPPKPGIGSKTRKLVEAAISNQLVEAAVINQLVEADVAIGNQDPSSTSSASTIKTKMSPHPQEIEIDNMMSTNEMLNKSSIAGAKNEENCN